MDKWKIFIFRSQAKGESLLKLSYVPKFDGDELDFPEFIRKNTTLVTNANLPEESKLDKLSYATSFKRPET